MKRLSVIGACALALAACGGGGGNPAADHIKAAYTSFFSTNGSLAAHAALVENGAKYESVIKSFLNNPLAAGVTATVSSVTMQGAGKAKVVYTVKISLGSLANQTGYAVLEGGKWKVSASTLCSLVALTGSTPSVCKS